MHSTPDRFTCSHIHPISILPLKIKQKFNEKKERAHETESREWYFGRIVWMRRRERVHGVIIIGSDGFKLNKAGNFLSAESLFLSV